MMFSEPNVISVVVQAGCVGVAVLALLVLYRIIRLGAHLIDNHLGHILTALGSIGEKLDRLIDAAERHEETK